MYNINFEKKKASVNLSLTIKKHFHVLIKAMFLLMFFINIFTNV